jgi:hypothetical protein
MLDCLTGCIGLASSVGEVESGLYLDALPDINLSNTNKIADGEQVDYTKVFRDVEKRTILKFRTFFIAELNRCFNVYRREAVDCLICENKELLAVSLWYLMGAEMLQERLGSNRINRFTTVDRSKTRELQEVFLDEFQRQLSTAVAGIDMEGSECFPHETPEHNRFIQVIETCP